MYVSTQKLPQIFLYMSTKCCKSFKSYEELEKKLGTYILDALAISPWEKNPSTSRPLPGGFLWMTESAVASELFPSISNLTDENNKLADPLF